MPIAYAGLYFFIAFINALRNLIFEFISDIVYIFLYAIDFTLYGLAAEYSLLNGESLQFSFMVQLIRFNRKRNSRCVLLQSRFRINPPHRNDPPYKRTR